MRRKALVGLVGSGSILLIVCFAFSAAVVGGLWDEVSLADLALIVAASLAILATALTATWATGQALGLARKDAVVLLLAGSQKSMASGVAIAVVLFVP